MSFLRMPVTWLIAGFIAVGAIAYCAGSFMALRYRNTELENRIYKAGFLLVRYQDPTVDKFMLECPQGHAYIFEEDQDPRAFAVGPPKAQVVRSR